MSFRVVNYSAESRSNLEDYYTTLIKFIRLSGNLSIAVVLIATTVIAAPGTTQDRQVFTARNRLADQGVFSRFKQLRKDDTRLAFTEQKPEESQETHSHSAQHPELEDTHSESKESERQSGKQGVKTVQHDLSDEVQRGQTQKEPPKYTNKGNPDGPTFSPFSFKNPEALGHQGKVEQRASAFQTDGAQSDDAKKVEQKVSVAEKAAMSEKGALPEKAAVPMKAAVPELDVAVPAKAATSVKTTNVATKSQDEAMQSLVTKSSTSSRYKYNNCRQESIQKLIRANSMYSLTYSQQ
jgi:hypothetical protein